MKKLLFFTLFSLLLISCKKKPEISSINPVNWEKKIAKITHQASLTGTTHLSVYSQVYSYTEHKKHGLTVTVSMRNTNRKDTVYIKKADFYNTFGRLIRSYFKDPIYLSPMETVEIVIDEADQEGGTGGNFMFDWIIKPTSNEPLFEAVMISTSGQQGLSFNTLGVKVD